MSSNSGASSWFYIWVPTRSHERKARSRSRSSDDRTSSSELRSAPPSSTSQAAASRPPSADLRSSCPPVSRESWDSAAANKESRPSLSSIREEFAANGVSSKGIDGRNSAKEAPATKQDRKEADPTEKDGSETGSTSTTSTVALPDQLSTAAAQDQLSTAAVEDAAETVVAVQDTTTSTCANESINLKTNDPKADSLEQPNESLDSPKESDSSPLLQAALAETEEDDIPTQSLDEGKESSEEPVKDQERSTMSFLEWEPMEDVCRKLLVKMKIRPVSVQYSSDTSQVLFVFSVPQEFIESVLLEFQNQGIGNCSETCISVVPANIHYTTHKPPVIEQTEQESVQMDSFYSSVKSRLLVAEVIARIQAGAEFSFDYLLLLILAGIIAFMGLIENSSVVLVASMLVSPLMGPILAGIFGGVIQDQELTRKGILYETLSLLICIAIGFLFGLIIAPIAEHYGCQQWPTQEMLSRGETRSLWVGILIAVPSGAGVALSVLGGNAGSLVGVAISASLLPPAVNCGILWAISLCIALLGEDSLAAFHGFGDQVNEMNMTVSLYENKYSENFAIEAFLLGLISLLLTLINILCIILTGVAILRLKEVTPEKIPQKFSNFWRRDIKAHRNYYKTWTKENNEKLLTELHAVGLAARPTDGLEGTFLQSMFDRASQDNDLINIKQWVTMPPSTIPPPPPPPVPKLLLNDEDTVKIFTPQNRAPFPVTGRSAPALRRSMRERSPYSHYATCHGPYAVRRGMNTYVNMPTFFASELRRSEEFRRRLYSAESRHEDV